MNEGPKQPFAFHPDRAEILDDPDRERWFPSDRVMRLLGPPPKSAILDFGAGTARYAIAAARTYPQSTVTVFDSQAAMLERAQTRVSSSKLPNLRLEGPDADALPSSHFDRIMALNVLHEIDGKALSQIRRTLRPDGTALFIDWDAAVPRDVGPPAEHAHTSKRAIELLTNAGFAASLAVEPAFPYHFVIHAERSEKTDGGVAQSQRHGAVDGD
jgi:ubiquinone/menaquinone biosynthesis C-methylase UbiE